MPTLQHAIKIPLICVLMALGLSIQAQERIFGVTQIGGENQAGVVYSTLPDGSDFQKTYDFLNSGTTAYGKLLEATNGRLYGTTRAGGRNNQGTVYVINKDGTEYRTLYHFDANGVGVLAGIKPKDGLTEGSDGKLYGVAEGGSGHIFSITKSGIYSTIYSFNFTSPSPYLPYGRLLEASNGKLYGFCALGGSNFSGAIFSINKDGSGFLVIHSFTSYSTSARMALMEATDGWLYGYLTNGALLGGGALIKLMKDGSGFSYLHEFDPALGRGPVGKLLEASNGLIYGTTYDGGILGDGILYSIAKNGTGFTVRHNFDIATEGGVPSQNMDLVENSSGKIFGTLRIGGINNSGTLFSINLDGTTFSKLLDFGGAQGAYPDAGVHLSTDGYLYGTTSSQGKMFRILEDATGLQRLHNFIINWNGSTLRGALVLGPDGLFYGLAKNGGEYNQGIIYAVSPDGTYGKPVYHFTGGVDGGNIGLGKLTLASNGKLYGMTGGGGLGNGTIFSYDPISASFSNIHNFTNLEGSLPFGTVIQASNGKLYGMNSSGGTIAGSSGKLFTLNLDGSGFSILHDFVPATGRLPWGNLLQASDGKLYGTTSIGGIYNYGVIFVINDDGSNYTPIFHFDGSTTGQGSNFGSSLLEASDGFLYGATEAIPGTNGKLYRIAKDGSGFTILRDVDNNTDGYSFEDQLIESSSGALYGAFNNGGPGGNGASFKMEKDGTGFTVLTSFSGNPILQVNGRIPTGSMLFATPTPFPVTLTSFEARRLNNEEVALTWTTSSERNNDGFEIEKSPDGISFESIGYVKGKGDSDILQSYTSNVYSSDAGWFRLRQIDLDGQISYSDTRFVEALNNWGPYLKLYPNPVIDILTIESEHLFNISLTSLTGQNHPVAITDLGKGKYQIDVSSLPAALYVLNARTLDGKTIRKIWSKTSR